MKNDLMGGNFGDEEESESPEETDDEDMVAKAMFRRLKTALKSGDDSAGLDAFKKLMACMPAGGGDSDDSGDEYEEMR